MTLMKEPFEAEADMRKRSRMSALFAPLLLATTLTVPSPASFACGYHDDVAMARGLLNWVYPDALHVIGTISTAVAGGRLPAPNFDAAASDLFGSRYRKTTQALEEFGEALSAASGKMPAPSFSIVLVEPVLWTRFEAAQGELRPRLHVTGPKPGDLVLVSGEAVVGEIAHGRLTIGEAYRIGLLRLYGSERQKAHFIGAYKPVGGEPPADLDRARSIAGYGSQHAAMSSMKPPAAVMASRASRSLTSEPAGELACGPAHH